MIGVRKLKQIGRDLVGTTFSLGSTLDDISWETQYLVVGFYVFPPVLGPKVLVLDLLDERGGASSSITLTPEQALAWSEMEETDELELDNKAFRRQGDS